MPIFEFKCTACAKITDEIVKSDTKEIVCDSCGSPSVKAMGSYLSAVHGLENGHCGCRVAKR